MLYTTPAIIMITCTERVITVTNRMEVILLATTPLIETPPTSIATKAGMAEGGNIFLRKAVKAPAFLIL